VSGKLQGPQRHDRRREAAAGRFGERRGIDRYRT
jgi:hypothetical protein